MDPIQGKVVFNTSEAQASAGGFADSLSGIMQVVLGFSLANVAFEIGNVIKQMTVGSVEAAANFDKLLHTIQGNTDMSNQSLGIMKDTILRMGVESGQPLDQLANGFMHITNEGFSASDSVKLLDAAMKAAVDTGSNTSDVANSLAVIMHNFGVNANQAGNYMNMLMQIAAHGNLTVQDLANNFQLVSSIASDAHVPIQQLGGMFDVLTKSTGDAARAQFEEERILTTMINPTKETQKELEALSGSTGGATKNTTVFSDAVQKTENSIAKTNITLAEQIKKYGDHSDQVQKTEYSLKNLNLTLQEHQAKLAKATTSTVELTNNGIDLRNDFTAQGLAAKGLSGVLDDVYKATNGNAEALKQLFPDQRAFIGVTALMKNNLSEYKDMVEQVAEATKKDLLDKEYQQRLNDMDVTWGQLRNTVLEFGIKIGNDVAPALTDFIKFLSGTALPKIEEFYNFIQNHQGVLEAMKDVLATLALSTLPSLLSAILKVGPAIITLATAIDWPIVAAAGLIVGLVELYKNLNNIAAWIHGVGIPAFEKFANGIINWANTVISAINKLISAFNSIPGWMRFILGGPGGSINIPQLSYLQNIAIPGQQNFSPAPAFSQGPAYTPTNFTGNPGAGNNFSSNGGISINNTNYISTPVDLNNFSRQIGLQVSMMQH